MIKSIARIAKRCPENITSVDKCVKLLFPKVLRKKEKKIKMKRVTVVTAVTVVTVVRKIKQPQKTIQHFCKEQFDTFDNQCDVLRAAFCDSRDVYFLYMVSPQKITLFSVMDLRTDIFGKPCQFLSFVI